MNFPNASNFRPIAAAFVAGLAIAGGLAFWLRGGAHDHPDAAPGAASAKPTEYTCSMHPQIRQPNPGTCPICAMDLIPAGQSGSDDLGPREVSLTEHAKALARIVTAPVERRTPDAEIRLFGTVVPDETRVRSITARFPARIERLYVNFTGIRVNAGDHLANIYSPELLTAQAELLGARRLNDPRALRSAREKLALWGLSARAIATIEARGEPSDTLDIDAPLGGFVMEKLVNEGDYLGTGAPLFRIADLTSVWIVLDAYELDKPWLRFGQTVTFTAEALPGQQFEARIAFIPPVLDTRTRTFKVRATVSNENLRLRPGMFVTGTVRAQVAGEGIVLDPSLEGKWISPMHPEIVKDGPGPCDVCGMDLVPAAELGYARASADVVPLVVPATAVLRTGRRAIVYVEVPERDSPTYEGREIVLGPRAGDVYLVASGLDEGERVVVNGAFKIDSTLQLLAKPSMMSAPDPDAPPELTASPQMQAALAELVTAYFPLWRALAGDDHAGAIQAAARLESATHAHHGLPGEGAAQKFVERVLADLAKFAGATAATGSIDGARVEFEQVSNTLIRAVQTLGVPSGFEVHLAYCPMTFEGRRADWLQDDRHLLNPYFGASMLRCGDFDRLDRPPAAGPPAGHIH